MDFGRIPTPPPSPQEAETFSDSEHAFSTLPPPFRSALLVNDDDDGKGIKRHQKEITNFLIVYTIFDTMDAENNTGRSPFDLESILIPGG